MSSPEDALELDLRRTFHEADDETPVVPDLAGRVGAGIARTRRRRRGTVVAVLASALVVAGAVATGVTGDRSRVDAADTADTAPTKATPSPAPPEGTRWVGPPPTDVPTELPTEAPPTGDVGAPGCGDVRATGTTAAGDRATVTLTNEGDVACDLGGLVVTADLGRFLGDRVRGRAFAGRSLLPPGGVGVVRLETWPGCQFVGSRLTVTLADGSTVSVAHPGEPSSECIEPAPSLRIATVEVAGEADPDLDGSTDLDGSWEVTALVADDGGSALTGVRAGEVSLQLDDGAMTGSTGCNSLFGTYVQDGPDEEDLRFPPDELGSTTIGCDEPPVLERLAQVRHVSGRGETRYLHAENWMIIAELRRAS